MVEFEAGESVRIKRGGVWLADGLQQLEQRHWRFTEDGEALTPEQDDRAEVVRELIAMTFKHGVGEGNARNLGAAWRFYVALAWAIAPSLVGPPTITELAQLLGITKAALSRILLVIRDQLGIVHSTAKLEQARSVYSERQTRIWKQVRASAPTVVVFEDDDQGEEQATKPTPTHMTRKGRPRRPRSRNVVGLQQALERCLAAAMESEQHAETSKRHADRSRRALDACERMVEQLQLKLDE